ncbi:MAG TPA: PIG-L family deacetylase [Solirubrobacteraceae bacterium]|nr:PIG-L family deacetylase [Solirubrobacteraceae bacterium]
MPTAWAADRTGSPPVALHLAPHPDDELLGAPATLMALRDEGWRVVNLACSLGRPADRGRRRAELELACERAGFELEVPGKLPSLGAGDDHLAARAELAGLFSEALARHRPGLLLAPAAEDDHHAHKTVALAALDALEGRPQAFATERPVELLQWSLWGDVRAPNLLVTYGEERLAEILHALGAHTGEIARNDYLELVAVRARAASIQGLERVIGFGAQGARRPYGELLVSSVLRGAGTLERLPPQVLDA